MWTYYAFIFFLATLTAGHHSRPDPRGGQGEGDVSTLLTQWTNVDPHRENVKRACSERRKVKYMVSRSKTTQPNLGFPMYCHS